VAPIDGRIGEAKVKVGNLVGPDPAGGGAFSDLATIQQLDPIGVDLRLSSRDLDRTTELTQQGLAVRLTRPGPTGPREHPSEGLDPGVPVIVEGLQMVRPGLPVKTAPAALTRRQPEGTRVTAAGTPGQAVVRRGPVHGAPPKS